jgi:hypothetical protein
MPEPTSTALAALTAATSSLAVVATAMGVPAPVVLAAVLGSALAVGQSERMELRLASLIAVAATFCAAFGFGIWGGALAGHVLIGLLNGLVPKAQLNADAADPICTVIVAMLGQRTLLPLVLKALSKRVEG